MNEKNKKILAKEFLAIFISILLTLLTLIGTYLYDFTYVLKAKKLYNTIQIEKEKLPDITKYEAKQRKQQWILESLNHKFRGYKEDDNKNYIPISDYTNLSKDNNVSLVDINSNSIFKLCPRGYDIEDLSGQTFYFSWNDLPGILMLDVDRKIIWNKLKWHPQFFLYLEELTFTPETFNDFIKKNTISSEDINIKKRYDHEFEMLMKICREWDNLTYNKKFTPEERFYFTANSFLVYLTVLLCILNLILALRWSIKVLKS